MLESFLRRGGNCSLLEGDEVHLSEESVHATISLTSLSHEAGESEGLLLSVDLAILINVSDLKLDGGVVVGGDQSVGGRALSGDVEVHNFTFIVLHLSVEKTSK